MAKIKIYEVEHTPANGAITVEIDFNYQFKFGDEPQTVMGIIKEMVEFWSGSESRLKENGGSYLKTFLKYLCQTALSIQMEKNYNLSGVLEAFENLEGWCSMNGDCGIKITYLEQLDLGVQEDYEIMERDI